MSRLDTIRRFRAQLLNAAEEHGAHNVRIFGSVARGTEREDSDLDVLIDLDPDRSLFDLVDLHFALEDIVGGKVEVVTERGLSPYLRDRILNEAVPL